LPSGNLLPDGKKGVSDVSDVILNVQGVTKEFPGVKALDDMCFTLQRGEIHALLGENGAGKSTLMNVLSGAYTPDAGEIVLDGERVNFHNPMDAEKKGISIVHQELAVFSTSTVGENIFTTNAPRNALGMIDYNKMYRMARELLDEYGFSDINERHMMRRLSVGRQQIVEILRAVKKSAKVLILDEPTSALTEKETDILMQIMRNLNDQGVSIIYISHRLEEVFRICDTATIMRDGRYITTKRVAETNKDELVRYMVGRDVVYQYGAGSSQIGNELLRLENVSYKQYLKNVSFSLHEGEVLGLAGLEGAGRTELLETIFGVHPPDSGRIYLKGEEVRIHSPNDAKALGFAFITKDRKNRGLFLRKSISDNFLAANLDRFTRRGFTQFKESQKGAEEYKERFDIKTPDVKKRVMKLSGGNQQKVLLSMWISRQPMILLIDEPTRGIDVGTKESIHALIREYAKAGMGVIMISSDMPELMGASDRIIAMYEGSVIGELNINNITEERIMSLTSGISQETEG
jgi:ABC-type sugar transport system ATPase subunit